VPLVILTGSSHKKAQKACRDSISLVSFVPFAAMDWSYRIIKEALIGNKLS